MSPALCLLLALAQPRAGLSAYLDALEVGRAGDAVAALNRALEADSEAAGFYTARGVARLLDGKLSEAELDAEVGRQPR
jgi:hypothetical protein